MNPGCRPQIFRRFPWAALAFCLACLSMTAWTWMRFSYAWRLSVEDVFSALPDIQRHRWPAEAYVLLSGRGVFTQRYDDTSVLTDVVDPMNPETDVGVIDQSHGEYETCDTQFAVRVTRWDWESIPSGAVAYTESRALLSKGIHLRIRPVVSIEGGRFHPASVAGLIVGVMGCFILGLYLRAWSAERKALASEPKRDMIA